MIGFMRTGIIALALAAAASGCYQGARVSRDVNEAWRGHARASIEARWGPAHVVDEVEDTVVLRWLRTRRFVTAPRVEVGELSEDAEVGGTIAVGPVELGAEVKVAAGAPVVVVQRGKVRTRTSEVAAVVDAAGVIALVQGPSWRRGPPRGANMRWGPLLGLHAGLGRLDSTGTPLPSGSVHLGGMLGPRHGLVGTFSLVSGRDDAGGAMGLAWGMAAQYWPATRVWLRAGPALTLDWQPGFDDRTLGVGVTTGASYALVKAGAFVLDLRLDATVRRSASFGSAGVGVNFN
jgi:hypothetical protein